MIINRISVQRKNRNRYNIFVKKESEESYAFSVSEDVLVKYKLRKGMSLTENLIQEITSEEQLQKVYNKAIRYLSYRMRSEKELRQYIQRQEIAEHHTEEIIDRLKQNRFLDDLDFAEMFVRSRINTSNKGPHFIEKELQEKGIHPSKIKIALGQYTEETEREKALKLIQKRLNRSSKHSFQRQLDQSRAALIRNGYSSDVIREVIEEVRPLKTRENEWEALQHHGERLQRRYKERFSGHELHQKLTESLYRQGFDLSLIREYLQTIKD